ncbi:MAG: ABC transporter ATP-binding protein [Bacillota bacterium]
MSSGNTTATSAATPARVRIWSYLGHHRALLIRGSSAGIGYNTLIVLGPILLGRALDSVLALERAGFTAAVVRAMHNNLLLLVLVTVTFQGLRTLKRWDLRRLANRIGTDLQRDILATTLSWPMPRLDRERIGDLMSRAVGDVDVVAETVYGTINEFHDTLILMLAYFAVLLYYDPWLTLICSLPAPLTAVASHYAGRWVFVRSTEARVAASRVNTHLQETLTGIRILRLFGREPEERQRLAKLCSAQLKANLAATLLQGGLMPVYAGLASLGLVAVIGLGGNKVIAGDWTVGGFTAYLTMFSAMTMRTLVAARVLNRLHVGRAAWARLVPKIDPFVAALPPRPLATLRPQAAQGVQLQLENVTFSFPGDARKAVDGLSIDAGPGSLICVTGPVGSGKSALAAALTGLYSYGGSIKLDGRELSSMTPDELPTFVAYAGQNPFLFSDTIKSNIAMVDDQPEPDRFRSAVDGAALSQDIAAFPEGWETLVGERGVQVSGGQRQRIALARAIYAGVPLIVLDDPFSAVDVATERRMITGLRQAAGQATVVLCSHRLGTFPQADLILVLDNGRLAELGRHGDLIRQDSVYARIFQAQSWLEEQPQ